MSLSPAAPACAGQPGGAGPGPVPGLLARLAGVPDPRRRKGRRHSLVSILGVAVCALASAGHDTLTAIGEWAGRASQETLAALGVRRDPLTGRRTPPAEATVRRVVARVDPAVLEDAVAAYLRDRGAHQQAPRPEPEQAPRPESAVVPAVGEPLEREQRRQARRAAPRRLAPAAAIDGKRLAGAVGPDGRHVHLLSATSHQTGVVLAQRRVDGKTNEIPELKPMTTGMDLDGWVTTIDALHTQRETARWLVEDCHSHYLMIIKENQPNLLAAAHAALSGTDEQFAATTHDSDGRGHGRVERRRVRTVPASGTDFPHAAQFFRIVRRVGGLDGATTSKEVVYGVTSLTPGDAGPAAVAAHARGHWTCENKTHYVRDVTFGEDRSQVRTANAPQVLAALRNLVIGAFRLAGYANIAYARRKLGADHRRILDLFRLRPDTV